MSKFVCAVCGAPIEVRRVYQRDVYLDVDPETGELQERPPFFPNSECVDQEAYCTEDEGHDISGPDRIWMVEDDALVFEGGDNGRDLQAD